MPCGGREDEPDLSFTDTCCHMLGQIEKEMSVRFHLDSRPVSLL